MQVKFMKEGYTKYSQPAFYSELVSYVREKIKEADPAVRYLMKNHLNEFNSKEGPRSEIVTGFTWHLQCWHAQREALLRHQHFPEGQTIYMVSDFAGPPIIVKDDNNNQGRC